MSQPLSPEQVAQLLPLLPEVVRLVVAGGHPAANELEMLLAGNGLDDEPYRAELQRWANILTAARASTDASRRDLAQRALVMRGVPETDAAQAAAAVTADTGVPVAAAAAAPADAGGPPWWWVAIGTALVLLVLIAALWFLAINQRLGQTALVPPAVTGVPTVAAAYPPPPTIPLPPTRAAYPAPTAVPVALAPTQAPTQAPTAAATQPPAAKAATATRTAGPTRTPTRNVSPTPRPPTRTPGPTPTLSPEAAACFPLIATYLAGLWRFNGLYGDLGCPIGTPQNFVTAVEEFERGYMFYRQDKGLIYALYNDGTSQVFQDSWHDGDDEYSCPDVGPSKTPPTPRRGIGKVWCNEPGVRDKLGQAKGDEAGYVRPIQEFEKGFMFATGDPPTVAWAVYNDSQRWQKG
ncbi:MAG: hypothetical protein U0822_18745 [Anaerolineae bacterium]